MRVAVVCASMAVLAAGCERRASPSTAPHELATGAEPSAGGAGAPDVVSSEPAAEPAVASSADPAAAAAVAGAIEPEPAPLVAGSAEPPRDPVAESTFVLLIASKRARKLAYADAAIDLFAPLPDYTLLIDHGGLDVMHDFDAILAATPDFRDFTRTFLVAEYTLPRDDMKAALDRAVRRGGQRIEWVEHDGYIGGNPVPDAPGIVDHDPRWFVLLPDGRTGVYVPPEFLGSIVPRAEGAPRLDHVATLRRLLDDKPNASLQFEVDHVSQRVHGWSGMLPGIPLHALEGIRVAVDAEAEPDFSLALRFADEASAAEMLRFWKKEVPELVRQLDFAVRVFVAPLLDQTKVKRKGTEIVAKAKLTGPQITWIVGLVAAASLQVSSKTPADIERMRQQRRDNWVRRREGKLPPAALE